MGHVCCPPRMRIDDRRRTSIGCWKGGKRNPSPTTSSMENGCGSSLKRLRRRSYRKRLNTETLNDGGAVHHIPFNYTEVLVSCRSCGIFDFPQFQERSSVRALVVMLSAHPAAGLAWNTVPCGLLLSFCFV